VVTTGCRTDTRRPEPVRTPAASQPSVADDRESAIIAELNAVRADPAAYATRLQSRRSFYRGLILRIPGETPIQTREGVAALDEAVAALRNTDPLPPVTISDALVRAARDHVRDTGPRGATTHEGSDGSSPSERVGRYASAVRGVGEVISFGPDSAALVIAELLVDDGVPDRGHRKLLLDPRFRLAGAACGPHARYRVMCVIDLADTLAVR
jgi:uncharacterized protein YkwD